MEPFLVNFAADVIRGSSQDRPTDGVLREALKADKVITKGDRRVISRAVFAYYRWKGFLPREAPIEARVEVALEFAEKFSRNQFLFSAEVLAKKAMPKWVAAHVEFRPDWLRAIQREPRLWLRARAGTARRLIKTLIDAKSARIRALPDAVEYFGNKDLYARPEFEAGEFEIQDIASQAVSVMCEPKPGETWWDACAGEGGKTLHLASLMQNQGLIWASDRAPWRLDSLKTRAARAQAFNYRAEVWDGSARLPTKAQFDGVLLDAPCTGLGTWHRNPHARWTCKPGDVAELAAVQSKLLRHAAPTVKPGGKLIYAVCTITRDETKAICDAFEQAHPEFEPLPLPNPFIEIAPPSPRWTLWPKDTGGNAMFVAAWRRKSHDDPAADAEPKAAEPVAPAQDEPPTSPLPDPAP